MSKKTSGDAKSSQAKPEKTLEKKLEKKQDIEQAKKQPDVEAEKEKTEGKIKKSSRAKLQKKSQLRSKRYIGIAGIVDKNKQYPIEEAVDLAKKTSTTKFAGSIEVHVRLGIDVSKSDQMVRGAIVLPHGTGQTLKVAVFTSDAKEKEAKDAGADIIGGQDLIDKIKQTSKIEFDVAIATPDMMPKLAMIAKILGPKGLMPSPKNETITTNLKKTIDELKKGKANFKNDDSSNIHNIIGKSSFEIKQLVENYNALLEAIKKAKPASAKGIFIKNISINATMGPGIRVAL